MKATFKPLGLAAAVAAVAIGYAGVVSAQSGSPARSIGNLGDLAIVPYYTVNDNWVTGVHIINSGATTQVVKLRLRRGSDSADALDFNLIMSPYDEWTGFLDDSSGNIVFATDDSTCTAPIRADGRFAMPAIFRAGADEGYIEVISMGQPRTESAPIARSAKHVAGVPRDCSAVASNFFRNVNTTTGVDIGSKGNLSNIASNQTSNGAEVQAAIAAGYLCYTSSGTPIAAGPATTAGVCTNDYVSTDNPLKVSYFFRDATAGTEMGNNAVHIEDASGVAWMTNQESGLFSGDVFGFDYPDLNGGPLLSGDRGLFNQLRASDVLGVSSVLNDWSVATARNVSTDWVVTMPGQYTMVDYYVWAAVALTDFDACAQPAGANPALDPGVNLCDFRDIPVVADLTLYDREEGVIVPEDGDLVISPAPPGTTNTLRFPYEVNVVEWTDGSNASVLGSGYATSVDPTVLGEFGWASLSVESGIKQATDNTGADSGFAGPDGQSVCEFVPFAANGGVSTSNSPLPSQRGPGVCVPATGSVPVTGFVAWQRSFPSNPDANYGRLVEHSFTSN